MENDLSKKRDRKMHFDFGNMMENVSVSINEWRRMIGQ